MNKKFLFGISALTCAMAVGAMMGARDLGVSASSYKDTDAHYSDTFKTFDETKWARVGDAESTMYQMKNESVVDVPAVTFAGFKANEGQMGYMRTENKIRLGSEKSLVVDIQGSGWTAGILHMQGLREDSPELAVFANGIGLMTDGMFANDFNGGPVTGQSWANVNAALLNNGGTIRLIVNPDGTGVLTGFDAAGTEVGTKVNATGMTYMQEGYWGLQGLNGFGMTLTNVKIGEQNPDGTGYAQIFQSCLVKDHANMADHGNVRWGSQTVEFKEINVQSTGKVHLGKYNYNDGNFALLEPVSIPSGKAFFVELDVENWSGCLGITPLVDNQWAWPNFIQINNNPNRMASNVAGVALDVDWNNNVAPKQTFRLAYGADGVGKFGTIVDGDWNTGDLTVANFANMPVKSSGYVHLCGNGGTLEADLMAIRVGYADDINLTNAQVLRGEDYRYAEPKLFGAVQPIGSGCETTVTAPVFGSEVHEMQLHSPVADSGLVYATAISAGEKSQKLGQVSLDLSATKFESGASVGLAFGLAEGSATSELKSLVSYDGTKYLLGDQQIVNFDPAEFVMESTVYADKIETKVGETVQTIQTTAGAGLVAITGACAANTLDAKVNGFTFDKYMNKEFGARNIDVQKFDADNYNWFYVATGDEGSIQLKGDQIEFNGADGCYFGTKDSYGNFELEADFEYFYDADEELIRSTWAGIVFGKEIDYSGCAWGGSVKAPMMYYQNTVIDFMNIPGVSRSWTSVENNPMQQGNNHIKIKAENGHVEMWLAHGEQEAVKYLDVNDLPHNGKIAFSSTAGGHYFIKSFKITNLEKPSNVNPTDTSTPKEFVMKQGETINGTISGTSAYGATVEARLVNADAIREVGTLEMANDGKWSFVANKDAKVGNYSFTYELVDMNVKTTGTITVEIKAAPKGGCGGSIIAASSIISIVSALGACLLLKRKKEDK